MSELRQLIAWEVLLFLFVLYGVVTVRLLTGQINTKWLLYGRKQDDTLYFSPERVQLLVFTLGAASYYLSQVLFNAQPGTLPPLSAAWPALIGSSNAIYVGGKAYSTFWLRNKSSE